VSTDKRDIVGNWLTAEQAGRSEDADRAFVSVAQALIRRPPPSSFAAAVMARVASDADPQAGWWTAWGGRTAVAACLLTLGVVLGTWPVRSMFFAVLAAAEAAVWGIDQVVTGSVVWVKTALTMWSSAAHAAVVVGRLLVTPEPALWVLVNLAVAACGCAALQRLLMSQED
jgi:hypothetical protein